MLWAVCEGYLEIVKVLIAVGADVNAPDKNGQTPLHFAVYSTHLKIAEALVASGADVNARDENGKTPRDLAALTTDHDSIKKYLASIS